MKTWWDERPERLDLELKALRDAGFAYKNLTKDAESGTLSLIVTVTQGGNELELRAEYPPFFPYVRFEIYAPTLDLPRHQNPFSKNLCILGRSTANWDVYDTLASLLTTQLPKLFETIAQESTEAVQGLELPQGEPFSHYYSYLQDSIVFVDSDWQIDSTTTRGRFEIEVYSINPFRARMIRVENDRQSEVAAGLSSGRGKVVRGRWARAQASIRKAAPEEILDAAIALDQNISDPRWTTVGNKSVDVTGILYPEETGWRVTSSAWLFLLRVRKEQTQNTYRHRDAYDVYTVRSGRAGKADMRSRAPEIAPFDGKSIALLGAGALGAAVAIEFARCGVRVLRIMDSDILEPGNAVRWPLGLAAAGFAKTAALRQFILENYPFTECASFINRFGSPPVLGGPKLAEYDAFFHEVELICDCTAESGLHYPTSELARERGVPYIAMSATPGLWGGRVFRIVPKRSSHCWMCLCLHWADGTIPEPLEDPDGGITPIGCADPTFSGANFNGMQISNFGVRLALDSLREDPHFACDLYNVAFREPDGKEMAPLWTPYALERHPKCANH